MTTTKRPMFPHCIDSTMLAAFRSCPQKMFRQYIEHWKPQEESVHLVAGKAFAKGIEVARCEFFEAGTSPEVAQARGLEGLIVEYGDFECPPDSAKSLERMCGALEYYFEQYPLGRDGLLPLKFANGKYAIEFSFSEPLDINHPVTGDPIIYTGRADMIGELAGRPYVVDEKTTSQLGASWPRQWENRSQFSGYVFAAKRAGLDVEGAIVRGVSILKTKYDTLQTLTYRPGWELDRWENQTIRDIARMIECWRAGYWDYDLDHACAEYGGCGLLRICKSDNPETWLPMQFTQRVWDPMARKELTVAEWEAQWGHEG